MKRLEGTLRTDRVNAREPRPPRGEPRLRGRLSKPALAEYRTLVATLAPMRILSVVDGVALELAAQALAEYRAAVGVLLRTGQSYECRTSAGSVMRRTRPEQAIAADAWRRAMHALEEFGLTPASRSKVEGLSAALPAASPEELVVAGDRKRPAPQPGARTPVESIDDLLARRASRDPARFFRD